MNKLILFGFLFLFSSCAKKISNEAVIYSNDFEKADLNHITGGVITSYNGSRVLGNYNNGRFELILNELPEHDLIDVSFDLYIHDSWEGNQQLNEMQNGPDIWGMKVNGKSYIYTTFSNLDCVTGNICPPQSYPADYPNNNYNPRSGATKTNLPGFCSQLSKSNGTTLYRISKSISHSDKTLVLECFDELKQKDAADPKCDESWTVDNIKIKAINLH